MAPPSAIAAPICLKKSVVPMRCTLQASSSVSRVTSAMAAAEFTPAKLMAMSRRP